MELKIRNVVLNYNTEGNLDNVSVGFDSFEDGLNLNGSVRITKEEYEANTGITALKTLVTTKITSNINE